jgi:hypothetical protein
VGVAWAWRGVGVGVAWRGVEKYHDKKLYNSFIDF